METEILKARLHILNVRRSQASPSASYDLPTLIGKMKHSQSWAKGELKNMILLNRPDKQVLLTALHERTEINSVQTNDSVTYHIIEGELVFRTMTESLILKEGQLLTLHEKVKYSLTTNADTVFLLTILNKATKVAGN